MRTYSTSTAAKRIASTAEEMCEVIPNVDLRRAFDCISRVILWSLSFEVYTHYILPIRDYVGIITCVGLLACLYCGLLSLCYWVTYTLNNTWLYLLSMVLILLSTGWWNPLMHIEHFVSVPAPARTYTTFLSLCLPMFILISQTFVADMLIQGIGLTFHRRFEFKTYYSLPKKPQEAVKYVRETVTVPQPKLDADGNVLPETPTERRIREDNEAQFAWRRWWLDYVKQWGPQTSPEPEIVAEPIDPNVNVDHINNAKFLYKEMREK